MKVLKKLCEMKKELGWKLVVVSIMRRLNLIDKWCYARAYEKYYKSLSKDQRKEELKKWYFKIKGEELNIENPQNFEQKMQWLKLYDTTPLKTKLADKYLVREWIKEKLGEEYLIPLVGVWNSFDEIDLKKLPSKFVFKANHSSGMNMVVKDKEKLNLKKVRKTLNDWMRTPFGWNAMELQYIDIPRKIIAEEYIEQMDGNLLDYKFFCFHGEPKLIQLVGDRDMETGTAKIVCIDTEWKMTNLLKTEISPYTKVPEKPKCFDEMLEIARKLSEDFVFVRVDLYVIDDKIKFGEMTFTPHKGIYQWDSPEDNNMVGEWINLEKLKDN